MANLTPEFAKALVKVQGTIEGAKKDKRNPGFNSKYADLSACWDACREALQENDIAVIQMPVRGPEKHVSLATSLIYGPTGEQIGDVYDIPLKDPTNPQALGSALTYGRRYALCAVIGICPEDDDGNAAAAKSPAAKKPSNPATEAGLKAEFAKATTDEQRKAVYQKAKTSDVAEPARTLMLAEFADVIKKGTVK